MMRFENAVDFVADLFDVRPGDLVTGGKELEIECLLDVAEQEKS